MANKYLLSGIKRTCLHLRRLDPTGVWGAWRSDRRAGM